MPITDEELGETAGETVAEEKICNDLIPNNIYNVYAMNGLAVPISETEELTYTVENLEYDGYYSFIVITYIGGEWSEADINNCVFVHIDESDAFEVWTDQDYIDYVNGFVNSTGDIVLNEYQLRAIEYVLALDYAKAS